MPGMIVDVHTHIFPPRMIGRRDRLAAADPGFGEMYGNPRARMATAEDLLASMDVAGVDVSVVAGFWWRSAEHAAEHATYLLERAAASGGRLVPFVPVDLGAPDIDEVLRALAGAGARGLGEVRHAYQSDVQSDVPSAGDAADSLLGRASAQHGLTLLVHSSEEVGHGYAGKGGGYTPGALWALLAGQAGENRPVSVIAAHWGGGFPFFALMPEVRELLESGRLVFDTAASSLLYEPRVFASAIELVGAERVLWGSDFPLRGQAEDRSAVEAAVTDAAQRAAVLGANAARLLRL